MLWVCGLPILFVHFHTQGNFGVGLESGKIRVRTEKLGFEGIGFRLSVLLSLSALKEKRI